MTSLEDRLKRLELELDQLRPSLHDRLDRLEQSAKAAAAPPEARSTGWGRVTDVIGRFVSWMGAELPKFLTAAIVLAFGYGIKDSVDLAIKKQQLNLSYANAIQGLQQQLEDRNTPQAQLERSAVVLATYGEPALPVLLSVLRHTGPQANAAAQGIRTLALTHRNAVCEALPRILSFRGRMYDWQAHLKVVSLLGENACTAAVGPLEDYRRVVDAAAKGSKATLEEFASQVPQTPDNFEELLDTIDQALGVMKGEPATPETGGR